MANNPKPSILFLLADQWRYDAVACNGAPICSTPALDAIAADGMRFDRAFTPIALCSPARGSILTGLYPHNHGQLANTGNFNGVFDHVIEGRRAYTHALSEAGYSVGYAGKWHVPREGDSEHWGIADWHTNRDLNAWWQENGIDFDHGRDNVQRLEWGGDAPFCGRNVLPADRTQESWCADRAIEMITRYAQADRPFVFTASFFGPHFPYAVPEPFDTLYDPANVPRWINFDDPFVDKPIIQQKEMMRWNTGHLTWPDWQRVIAHYWGYCTFIDQQIGRVIESLKSAGLYENTAIVFAADHGDMMGSHRMFNKGFAMYEETHHIPLVVRWPGVTRPGSVCSSFASLTDLMPTFADMGGAQAPREIDGRSLEPLLRGTTPADWPDDAFSEFHGYESTLCSVRMVRTEKWKYVYNPCSEDELYDMESDPGELQNLAPRLAFKHTLRRMKARLVERLRETGDTIVEDDSWKGSPYDLYISERER